MSPIPIILGLGAIVALFAAGYLCGVRRGAQARDSLRSDNLVLAQEIGRLETLAYEQTAERDHILTTEIRRLLAPLVQNEHFSPSFAAPNAGASRHCDVTNLLDQIAEIASFSTLLLCDDDGLPLAASGSTSDPELLAAVSSLCLLTADKIEANGLPPIQSVMLHDEAGATVLCRIFHASDQRLVLIAVSSSARLAPTALDPSLARLGAALAATG
jgi:hypothetical protein